MLDGPLHLQLDLVFLQQFRNAPSGRCNLLTLLNSSASKWLVYNKASLNRAMCLYNKSNTSSTLHNSNSINKGSIKQRSNGPPKEPQEGPARKDLNHQL